MALAGLYTYDDLTDAKVDASNSGESALTALIKQTATKLEMIFICSPPPPHTNTSSTSSHQFRKNR